MRSARALPRIDTSRLMRRGGELILLLIIAAFFVAGAVAGALAGSEQLPAGETLLTEDGSVYGRDTFPGLLFDCARYHLLVLLFSTSLIGVLLIPATLAFRGFTLACSAAYLIAAYPEQGVGLALTVLGLPALLTVPSLFVTAHAGALFSSRLLAAFTRRPLPMLRQGGDGRALAVAAMLAAAAGVEYFLVPPIVRLLIK